MANPHPRRRGFIILIGWRHISSRESADPVSIICPHCNQESLIVGKVARRWFTLFFLPIFPVESKANGIRFCQCTVCKARFDIPIEQMMRRISGGHQHWQAAIQAYNDLRDNPTDSDRLHRVMQIYLAMGEYRQAASAARDFPQAFQASDKCAQILEKVQQATQTPPLALVPRGA